MAVITAFTYVDVEMTAVFLSMDVEVMAVYCPVNVVLTALLNSWTRSNVLLGGCGGDSTVQLADVEVTTVSYSVDMEVTTVSYSVDMEVTAMSYSHMWQ